MKFSKALEESRIEDLEKEFEREVGKVKAFLNDYPYGQESYTEVEKYKEANKVVADLQFKYFKGKEDWQKLVDKARNFLNKMAHDFGDYYKGKENEKWRDAMLALDRIKEIGGK
jgi:hypothetical protein